MPETARTGSPPSTTPDNLDPGFVTEGFALSALVNLILVLADNKYFLGRRLSEWCPGAPSLESAVAAAALAQEELGHARALYPLLEEMPVAEVPVPLQRGAERKRRYSVCFLEDPLPTWPHVVAALALLDPALTVMFNALADSRYDDLRKRARRIPGEESFHRKYADGRVRDMARTEGGRRELQARVDELLPEMLCWFGPTGERGVEELKREGLLDKDSDELRAAYLDDIGPALRDVGIELDAGELPWDRWNQLQRRLER
ncbi:MAG: ring,2-phenylacetyl-CoA epoxidase subunit PaaC [Solirubrobacteraceae bacterium]|nr:ring,2-phenylacetyl-CoA epoxidase subunit PaaC [Solirubrobacteraceae bacterium]